MFYGVRKVTMLAFFLFLADDELRTGVVLQVSRSRPDLRRETAGIQPESLSSLQRSST